MKLLRYSTRSKGYSLVEALTASALLGLMIGGAVALVSTLNLQERVAFSGTVALNMEDCAAHLWQFGLSPAEVLTVLPTNTNNEFINNTIIMSGSNAVTFGTPTTTTLSASMGTLENVSCAIVIQDPQGKNNRTSTVQVYRPQLR